jgi:MFS family permease
VLFAFGDAHERGFMLLIGIALHGVCYDFFFVSGQIYTDSKAGPRYKTAAQGLVTLATYGVGMLIGFWSAGRISDWYLIDGIHDWKAIWLYPAAFAADDSSTLQQTDKQGSFEARFASNTDQALSYIAGLYYLNESAQQLLDEQYGCWVSRGERSLGGHRLGQ